MIKYIKTIFTTFSLLWYSFYLISFTNFYPDGKFYLDKISYFYYLFLSSVLFISFNPFYKLKYNKIYGEMAFGVAMNFILSYSLMEVFNNLIILEKKLEKDIGIIEKLKIIFNLKTI